MTTSKYNRSEIMKEAHKLYQFNRSFNWSFSKCLTLAWRNTKMRIANAEMAAQNKAVLESMTTGYNQNVVLRHVGINSLYANRVYSGD